MVFLFDDTSDLYIKKYIDFVQYDGVIKRYSSMSMSTFDSIRDEVRQADCIMIHRSFRDESKEDENNVYETIVIDISGFGKTIPLVVFSGEDRGEADFKTDTFIRKISKDKFYCNLKAFLDEYKAHGKVSLDYLAHGNSVDFIIAINMAQAVLKRIRFKDASEVLFGDCVAGKDFLSLVEIAQPAINCSYAEIMAEINAGSLTVGGFRERISKIIMSFNAYGKNIYSWR